MRSRSTGRSDASYTVRTGSHDGVSRAEDSDIEGHDPPPAAARRDVAAGFRSAARPGLPPAPPLRAGARVGRDVAAGFRPAPRLRLAPAPRFRAGAAARRGVAA